MDDVKSQSLRNANSNEAVAGAIGLASTPADQSGEMFDKTCVNVVTRPIPRQPTSVSSRLGRYEIIKKLGEGGMGAVFHARDTVTGQEVALKVLAAGCLSQPDSLRRFEKEARLLEEAKSPHVANLLDVGTDGDTRFLVMEFVKGCDLRQWINKHGSLDETSSLEIIGELCQALVTAHAKGMVHRDIKPENVLLSEVDPTRRPEVKLTDFGLARHIDQSESLKLTQTGALLGTPYYMSPEQFTGAHEISPATDVYSMGATFFELLTGRRPFIANDPIQLATAHCFDAPPDIRKLNSQVSDATAELARRMLAKLPGQRPPDASAVLEEILRLQNGDSSQFVVHPVLPLHNTTGVVKADFEWKLSSSPKALWPFVSNTERFNQAAGFQPVTYETHTDRDGRIRKFGQFRLAGISLRWEEHPFEWIEGQRFSILREFPSGPFVWFMSIVELVPNPDGGTLLKHQVKIEPRGIVGRVLAKMELGAKGQRKLERIYQRIDNTVSGKNGSNRALDPYRAPSTLKNIQRQRLEQRLDKLATANVSAEIVEVLRDLVLNGSAQDVARLRPYAIASRFGLPEREVVEACLNAVPIGLLTLQWDVICPTCRLSTGGKSTLREIEQHANCNACQTKFDIEFGSSLELIFGIHPEIRTSDSRTYCAGGPGNFPHVVAQVRLEPGERVLLPLSLESGSYVARGPSLPYAVPIDVDSQTGMRHGKVRCVPGSNRAPVSMLRAGHQSLALENFFPGEQVIRIERTVRRSEALTAAQVTALPLFRELFPEQTLAPGMLVEIATANFLVVQMDGLEDAFRELGDAGTYSLVQDFWRIVERQIHRQRGSVVDRSAGMLLATFLDPVVAIETARELATVISSERPDRQWSLSGALNRGPALVTGDRQDVKYFGTTIGQTYRMARDAPSGCLLLAQVIWSDPGVAAAFANELRSPLLAQAVGSNSIRCIALNTLCTSIGNAQRRSDMKA